MANDPKQNQRPDQTSVNDPNRERDNDGQRRQQEAGQNRPGQQGGQPGKPQDQNKPEERKPQQR